MSVSAPRRKNRAVLAGTIAAAFLVISAAAGGLWWQNERHEIDQASKADCVLAQKILDDAQDVPHDKAAADKWEQSTIDVHAQIKNDLLSVNMAQYENWVVNNAKGEDKPPTEKEQKDLADTVNGHCSDAEVTLAFPTIRS